MAKTRLVTASGREMRIVYLRGPRWTDREVVDEFEATLAIATALDGREVLYLSLEPE